MICIEVLNSEACRFFTISILFCYFPSCISGKVVLAEISWQFYCRLELVICIQCQLRVTELKTLLNVTYSNVE